MPIRWCLRHSKLGRLHAIRGATMDGICCRRSVERPNCLEGRCHDEQCIAPVAPRRRHSARRRHRLSGVCRAGRKLRALGRRGQSLHRFRAAASPCSTPAIAIPKVIAAVRGAARRLHAHRLPDRALRALHRAVRAAERAGAVQGRGQDHPVLDRRRSGRERRQDRARRDRAHQRHRLLRRLPRPHADDHGADRQGGALQEEVRADAGRHLARAVPGAAARRDGRGFAQGARILFRADVDPVNVAAIIIEPVQGEGGFHPAPDRTAARRCARSATSTASC